LVAQNGQPSTLTASFIDAPQTGSLPTDFRFSQFAALATGFHPSAQPTSPADYSPFGFFASQTDAPNYGQVAQGTFFLSIPILDQDVNYATLTYGQVMGAGWHDIAQVIYSYDITLPAPPGLPPVTTTDYYFRLQALPQAT